MWKSEKFTLQRKLRQINSLVQGDPNQRLQFQMAVTLQMCIFDPPLVKPKCALGMADFFLKIVNKQTKKKSTTPQTHNGLY